MNAVVPAFVAERYRRRAHRRVLHRQRLPLTPVRAAARARATRPRRSASTRASCLGARADVRRCAGSATARRVAIVRLNYAHRSALRRARRPRACACCAASRSTSTMGYVNVIWQGDANAHRARRACHATAPPPFIVNVAGPERAARRRPRRVRSAARLGATAALRGREAPDALLSDSDAHARRCSATRWCPLDTHARLGRRLGRARRHAARQADEVRGARWQVLNAIAAPAATTSHAATPGQVIPAHPLALTADRTLDERRQRALTRYYLDAGAGGIAVGVHTTQFAIRDPRSRPASPRAASSRPRSAVARARGARDRSRSIAGVCGDTRQAVAEAELAAALGYDVGAARASARWRRERRGAARALPRRRRGAAAVRLLSPARRRRARAALRASGASSPRSRACGRSRSRRSTATRRSTSCAPSPTPAATTSRCTPATTTTSCSTC